MGEHRDWRADYLICEHLAADPDLETRHHRFRAICEECYGVTDSQGIPVLLMAENVTSEKRGPFEVITGLDI